MNKLGFWEQPGRNPVLAAIVVTGLVTAIYSFAGGLVANGIMFSDMIGSAMRTGSLPKGFSGDYLESVKQVYDRYRIMILVLTTVMEFAVFLGGTLWFYRVWHGGDVRSYFKLSPPKLSGFGLPVVGLVCLFPLAIFLGELAVRTFPFLKELEDVGSVLVRANSPLELVFVLAVIGLTPAICEEFLFRGYFQSTLSRGMGQPWSYILSGIVFALIHQNYFGLGTLILVGIYLGFVFTRFGSIWAGSIVHFCYNSLLVIMANQPQWFKWLFSDDGLIRWQALVFGLITTPCIVWLIILVTKPKTTDQISEART